MQLEEYLERDDRIVLPVGSTEQHAYLSLETDNILAERIAVEAAEPLGVPVLPALAYGLTPSFAAYPGSLDVAHRDVRARDRRAARLARRAGLPPDPRRQRSRRQHAGALARRGVERRASGRAGDLARLVELAARSPRRPTRSTRCGRTRRGRRTSRGRGSRASSFPRRRRSRVPLPLPLDPAAARRVAGDGSFGGRYARPDEEVLEVWRAGVEGVRALLESGWTRFLLLKEAHEVEDERGEEDDRLLAGHRRPGDLLVEDVRQPPHGRPRLVERVDGVGQQREQQAERAREHERAEEVRGLRARALAAVDDRPPERGAGERGTSRARRAGRVRVAGARSRTRPARATTKYVPSQTRSAGIIGMRTRRPICCGTAMHEQRGRPLGDRRRSGGSARSAGS